MSATAHPMVQKMGEAVGRYNAGEVEAVVELFKPDAVWHDFGHSSFAGDHRGHDAIRRWFEKMQDLDAKAELVDVLADDTFMVFILHVASADGRLDQIHANAWVIEDGLISEGWFMPDDRPEFDAFVG